MSKIGQQISEFRKTTPKSVQWILLAAAIIIVIVLMILLVGGRKAQRMVIDPDSLPVTPELIVTPDAPIDWANTLVGDVRETEFLISANTRIRVTNVVVRVEGDTNDAVGISATETCKNDQTIIEEDMPCTINIKFQPEHPISPTDAHVAITWSAFETGAEVDTPDAITLVIGAREEHPASPKYIPEPEPEPEPVEDFEYDYTTNFQDDLDNIAAPITFDNTIYDTPQTPEFSIFRNTCSDFAFPGYNTAGIQSGWIKPMGGRYYYHPFSDTNCDTPTGIYNAETGYIMDINNQTRKIGSDSEHVRFVVQDRIPRLGSRSTQNNVVVRAKPISASDLPELYTPGTPNDATSLKGTPANHIALKPRVTKEEFSGYSDDEAVYSTQPFDRSFVLRQYKPIPATIVSDIQADVDLLTGGLPVRATVDRNVYSDNGRTVIIPTGTLMLGYVTGKVPGPYKAVGRMQIQWYQFIRPDGVEFSFDTPDKQPFAADSQGRKGVPGHGSTDYLQQFVMPMLTAVVPAAVNLIAPISDSFVNQIDLDNNTVVQSGTVRSSEMAKNEIINAWNAVASKLLVDLMDNTTPPFSIAAGTRITVFSPVDLIVTCGDPAGDTRKCAIHPYGDLSRGKKLDNAEPSTNQSELIGQVRSMLQESLKDRCCQRSGDTWVAKIENDQDDICKDYSFSTLDFYCRSFGTYEAINNAKQAAIYENQKQNAVQKSEYEGGPNTKEYNEQVLGLKYNDDNSIQNPFNKSSSSNNTTTQEISVVTCDGGVNPDVNGCCPGETYTDMGDAGFNCCPDAGGDCFPPIEL